jgi:hypothetical protein
MTQSLPFTDWDLSITGLTLQVDTGSPSESSATHRTFFIFHFILSLAHSHWHCTLLTASESSPPWKPLSLITITHRWKQTEWQKRKVCNKQAYIIEAQFNGVWKKKLWLTWHVPEPKLTINHVELAGNGNKGPCDLKRPFPITQWYPGRTGLTVWDSDTAWLWFCHWQNHDGTQPSTMGRAGGNVNKVRSLEPQRITILNFLLPVPVQLCPTLVTRLLNSQSQIPMMIIPFCWQNQNRELIWLRITVAI